ncbi:MAG: stage V sporulation protein AD [Longibaculum muris]|uniref:Stage V sporulation protein AD n=1 Tax=Longibaculum muris TaxID=1796628 RepID=A0A4R3ZB55_9FIRM|nr:stage V sporulation protein AD [Longibaculum muris]KXU48984.1 stage V sporulation protein AD [Candidatus Stoquefichus sp. KLE1796]MBS5369226.1 stage V sporulation protein AD [Coprobacillus cateniformis]MCR1886797.1 stage V sporulation protein AD [Longibaculum muris]MED9810543.1 stage V sporulation protein AD [Longibaculum muris]TCW02827.1 stage V sporulation protein AD [Longibaculum muris]
MSSHFYGNSLKLENVYIASTGSVCGPLEFQGPLGAYFDKSYTDYHCNEDSFEKAERKMLRDALDICLKREKLKYKDIDLYLGGDLMNQITTVHYLARELPKPFVGIYGACSNFALSMAMSALIIEGGFMNKIVAMVSSHNATAERQYRYPVEYGVQKKDTTTFTATGAVATLLTNQKTPVRVEAITLGKVVDYSQTNPNDMGRAMAPAAYDTIMQHFQDLKRGFEDYDLVVTGDLSTYGHQILKEMLQRKKVNVVHYNDCGCMLYDVNNQEVFQGGSGCACSALVAMGYLYPQLKEKKLKRILVVSTGALLSPMMTNQKESIPCVAHAVSLEVSE